MLKLQIQRKILPIVDSRQCIPEPDLDVEFFCNSANRDQIFQNIKRRKSNGDIDKVLDLCQKPDPESKHLLSQELSRIPNLTHPAILELDDDPKILKICGNPPEFDFRPTEFEKLAVKMRLLRTESLGPVSGQRSYIFLGDLADLEQALIYYTIEKLKTRGFKVVSVPDILPTKVIERCGLIVDGDRTLIYQLDSDYGDEFSLSGTAEMALAYKLMNSTLEHDELPLKMAAVSRCYRAEGSSLAEERGIYRYTRNSSGIIIHKLFSYILLLFSQIRLVLSSIFSSYLLLPESTSLQKWKCLPVPNRINLKRSLTRYKQFKRIYLLA